MNKQEFLSELRARLIGMPKDDIEERISFYGEMIDDRMEEGLTEEQATAELGSIESVYAQIMSDIPLAKFVKEKVKPNRTLHAWEIVLLAAGSPVWLSLFIALFASVIAVYAVIWSVLIALWAVEAAFAVCSVSGLLASIVCISKGNLAAGIAMLGAGFVFTGLVILCFIGCKGGTIGVLKLTKRMMIGVKACFIKRGVSK